MNSANFFHTITEIESGIERGLHAGAVVHVRRDGKVIADLAIGYADSDRRVQLQPGARMLLLSAGKPLTASAIALLVQNGKVGLDDSVSAHIPEFAANDKENITFRHVLTHTHAWQAPAIDWPRLEWNEIIGRIANARVPEGREPGHYAAYDPQTGWYILAEAIQRITGEPFYEYVEREIVQQAGAGRLSIGLDPEEWQHGVEDGSIVRLLDTTGSASDKTDLRKDVFPNGGQRLPHPWVGDDAQRASVHNPGGGALGTASELGVFYQMMLDASGPLSRETLKEMTSRQREGLRDESFRATVDWGLGFLINSARYNVETAPYGYGCYASDATFGHGGMQSTSGYADPVNGLAVAIIFNGLCGEPKHQKRVLDVNSALYRDLGLASE